MKEVVIHIENLSKKFFINRQKTLKKSFSAFVKRMLLSGVGESKESFYALKEINLEVFEGDVIGIIGHNGSGKSTLLRIIAGITTPSSGKVLVRRKMVSVLDVGMGFHNELSGRDNIFLCCAFYGIPRSETEKLMASIINFSNIGTFIDTPVKHYSKGMYLRLAFSIIIHIDAGILVFDEAISVGDQEFKNKIFNRIKELNAEGKTIVIVSHKMEEILALTSKCLLLNKGEALLFDTSYLVVNKYFSLVKNSLKNIAQNSSTATKKRSFIYSKQHRFP
jgi:ABC-type polysaccharide/polyol phosphate transport system ATPase subunit